MKFFNMFPNIDSPKISRENVNNEKENTNNKVIFCTPFSLGPNSKIKLIYPLHRLLRIEI